MSDTNEQSDPRQGHTVTARLGGQGETVTLPIHPYDGHVLAVLTDRYWLRQPVFMREALTTITYPEHGDDTVYASLDWSVVERYLRSRHLIEKANKRAVLAFAYEMHQHDIVGMDFIVALGQADRERITALNHDVSGSREAAAVIQERGSDQQSMATLRSLGGRS